MQLTLLKCKIHRATVTEADLNYEGSIGIDAALLKEAGIVEFERVEIYNITNGERFATYAISMPANSGAIQINGAAARLCQKGDLVIICAYARMDAAEAKKHEPKIVLVGGNNTVASKKVSGSSDHRIIESSRRRQNG